MWIFDQDKRQDRRDVADLKELLTTQLKALGEGRYELTLRTRDDQVSYAHVSAADILDRVRDLRAVNMAGTDIALRPAARSGLVLLRDVPAAQVADLTRDGFPPVLLTEPAPARFDAWVRVDSVGIQRGLHDRWRSCSPRAMTSTHAPPARSRPRRSPALPRARTRTGASPW